MPRVLEFKLPDLGEGLTEAEIVRWLVEVGDVVAVDQPVVEVETAKAMVEVPCPYGGVVTARFGEEGTELPVGSPLLTVAVGAETSEEGGGRGGSGEGGHGADGLGGGGHGADGPGGGDGATDAGSGNVLVGYGTTAPAARRRRVRPTAQGVNGTAVTTPAATPGHGSARTPAAPATSAVPTSPAVPAPVRSSESAGSESSAGSTGSAGSERSAGSTGSAGSASAGSFTDATRVAPVGAAPGRPLGPVPVISPLVRRLARDNGLDLRHLSGSGPEGLILRTDVERALRPAEPAPVAAPTPGAGSATAERIPLKGVRGAVADKLSRSRREIPDATCWVDADATELMAARTAMNGAGSGPKVPVLALLARICAAALARFPELNSTVDTEAREIVRLPDVHLGFAAQTERGLVVPVVRDAHTRNVESLGAELVRLTEAARTGRLTPAQLTGGTFTLNNYGVFGVDGSTPIINHPEAAMLGVGRIVPKPWVYEGELAVRQVVQLSLTFDHRVCDGGTAGGFLRYVADCVEHPALLLRTL